MDHRRPVDLEDTVTDRRERMPEQRKLDGARAQRDAGRNPPVGHPANRGPPPAEQPHERANHRGAKADGHEPLDGESHERPVLKQQPREGGRDHGGSGDPHPRTQAAEQNADDGGEGGQPPECEDAACRPEVAAGWREADAVQNRAQCPVIVSSWHERVRQVDCHHCPVAVTRRQAHPDLLSSRPERHFPERGPIHRNPELGQGNLRRAKSRDLQAQPVSVGSVEVRNDQPPGLPRPAEGTFGARVELRPRDAIRREPRA